METDVEVVPLAGELSDALKGAVYPLRPKELAWVAGQNEAPQTVISIISDLPLRAYASLDDVQTAAGPHS